ncbi:MAG: glucose-1-phosphate adenylyltransferase [Planctomycetaceae bacterium]
MGLPSKIRQQVEQEMARVLTLILAGGKGTRLEPLTRDRAKPAVPFGGIYRIVDFTLSNCLNSGLRRILLLTQYKAASLDRHINLGWRFMNREFDEFIDILPPQQRLNDNWYSGTADAVYQNIYSIERSRPDLVLILAGDHIYKMDYSAMIAQHEAAGAELTIACLPVPLAEGRAFGVMQVDGQNNVVDFREKPDEPHPMPGDSSQCLASMGIYVFNANFLYEELCQDAMQPGSQHDFGRNIIPRLIGTRRVQAFPFRDKNTGHRSYWRDVGTIDAFYEANRDLIAVEPELNLYDTNWPIRTFQGQFPPPKFIFSEYQQSPPRVGHALDSMVSGGCVISGGAVVRSILSPGVRVKSWSVVEDSLLFDDVEIGRHAQVRRAIIDKGVKIADHDRIGFDHDHDRTRGFTVSEGGVVVIGKGSG